jgi:O-methyltransferase
MDARGYKVVQTVPVDPAERAVGKDWPADAETMIGLVRLANIQQCIETVLHENVAGDLIETGVWRGGATIFMRAVLAVHDVRDRTVWVADSFEGLPKPDETRYPAEAGDEHWTFTNLVVSLEDVQANFAKYGLLDDQVRFLKGWFRDTLPSAPIHKLAVARLDGDMYGSTMEALDALYPKLSIGGFLIVDDYGAIPQCRQAVEDFRDRLRIGEPLTKVDWTGVYWRKEREARPRRLRLPRRRGAP